MKRPGGLRTRWLVAWARLLWDGLRHHLSRGAWTGTLELIWEDQQRRDRQRVCPHWDQISHTAGWVDCQLCGACLLNPAGPTRHARRVIIVEKADGFGWERRNARPGWQDRYAAKGLPTP